jgi:D-alanyl-D-alanine carboxypeptidase
MQLISVTLNCGNDFVQNAGLLQYGFDEYDMVTLVEEGTVCGSVQTDFGSAQVVAPQDVRMPVGQEEKVETKIELPVTINGSYQKGSAIDGSTVCGRQKIQSTALS